MALSVPEVLAESIEHGAARLGRALEVLEWPNAGTNAPCHEINALLNILYHLHAAEPSFLTYAEGTTANRGRVDAIGFNGQIALAIEAKAWGRINNQANSVLADWRRLASFAPRLSEVAGNHAAIDWWQGAEQRWRVIVITSFRGDEVKDAWLSDDEGSMRALMAGYTPAEHCREEEGTAVGFLALWREIPARWRRAARIVDGTRWNAGSGWLLWAAEPL